VNLVTPSARIFRDLFRRKKHKSRLLSSDVTIPTLIMAIGLGLATAALSWLGYRASQEWRKSTRLVEERRADEVTTLLSTALARDMRGVQQSILVPFQREQLVEAYEISNIVARAFAQFPYPESFFVWTRIAYETNAGSAFLFNRTDRPPKWEETESETSPFPVTTIPDSPLAYRLSSLARDHVLPEAQSALFETVIEGSPYQVVTRLFYGPKKQIVGVIGFTVNLDWIRDGYFPELTGQIERIGGQANNAAFSLSILDEGGKMVTQSRPARGTGPMREKQFFLAFFDLSAVSADALNRMSLRQWTVRISGADDPLLGAADSGAKRTLILILVATVVAITAIVHAVHALRTKLELAAMKSDFIDTFSHELKTPLASVSLVGETLSNRRNISEESIADYGSVLLREATNLSRLLENLLAISRITHSKNTYVMTAVNIHDAVTEAVKRLQPQIRERAFDVICHESGEIPNVCCDRVAIVHVFENLIENAIKYSDTVREIEISISAVSDEVNATVKDRGKGIFPEDMPHIFERFFRGRNAGLGGSGLGLAIARNIVEAHHGRISVESVPGDGTSVIVSLPAINDGAV
jgi:signal transduction histidine kinase